MKQNLKIIDGKNVSKELDYNARFGELCGHNLYVEKAIIHEGDIQIDGDLTANFFNQIDETADLMIIKGSLTIKGDMNPLEETFPNIIVEENMIATNFQHGEEIIAINGDLNIKNLLFGRYPEGGLKVNGTTTAKYIINDDHYMIFSEVITDFFISSYGPKEFEHKNYVNFNEFEKMLKPMFIDTSAEYRDIKMDLLVEQLKLEKEVFKNKN